MTGYSGRELQRVRLSLDVSIAFLSTMAGVSATTIAKAERRDHPAACRACRAMAAALLEIIRERQPAARRTLLGR